MLATVTNSKALWYLTRGTGLVALLLLTISVVLGIVETVRWASPRWPRYVVAALHKNVSLLATAFLAVHIATTVIDGFAPIGWLDAVLPFHSPYRSVWLGFGALSVDIMIALVVTSLVRPHIGYPTWRAVHWAAYGCWPLAVIHGLGAGTDSTLGWVVLVNVGCVVAVAGTTWWRLVAAVSNSPESAGRGRWT